MRKRAEKKLTERQKERNREIDTKLGKTNVKNPFVI